ncbi:MAG: hypothetical protein WDO15_23145 [Bacteroidota bacterium]
MAPLILQSEEEVRRFIECLHMKDIRNKIKEEMNDAKSSIQVKNAAQLLKNERCVINITK